MRSPYDGRRERLRQSDGTDPRLYPRRIKKDSPHG